ncbi:hypothetical protein [Coralliovum pocilloporae]|uniref:hypothetical protein n=1 Tax=Coralliovum pocilloporae TaxID=3066369 RepID=UPI00330730D8
MTASISFWRLFGRLLIVPFAFMVTLVCVGIFVAFSLAALDPDFSRDNELHVLFTTGMGFLATSILGGLVFAPAALAILACEILRLRSLFVYLAIGGVLGFAGTYAPIPDGGSVSLASEDRILVAAGLIGGFIYWLLAGRNAGFVVSKPEDLPDN